MCHPCEEQQRAAYSGQVRVEHERQSSTPVRLGKNDQGHDQVIILKKDVVVVTVVVVDA